jgi:alpha-glucosidase (family GH31 glycosyl hydrolase)
LPWLADQFCLDFSYFIAVFRLSNTEQKQEVICHWSYPTSVLKKYLIVLNITCRGNPFVNAMMVDAVCEVIVYKFNDEVQTVADGLTLLVAPITRPVPRLRDRVWVQKTC